MCLVGKWVLLRRQPLALKFIQYFLIKLLSLLMRTIDHVCRGCSRNLDVHAIKICYEMPDNNCDILLAINKDAINELCIN